MDALFIAVPSIYPLQQPPQMRITRSDLLQLMRNRNNLSHDLRSNLIQSLNNKISKISTKYLKENLNKISTKT